jgi:hypothetical protein
MTAATAALDPDVVTRPVAVDRPEADPGPTAPATPTIAGDEASDDTPPDRG